MELKKIKLLYLSCHSALEFDDLKLFHELGIQVFSHGSYVNPQNPGDPKRPILNLPYDPHFAELCSKYPKEHLGRELVESFDVIYSLWMPAWVIPNWEVLRDKIVILRTIGQSVPHNELSLKSLYENNQNFKIVRYSPQEELIPGYIGADATIRFYKDPEEFKDWNGKEKRVITVGQSMKYRSSACAFEFFEKATRKFERRLFGPGNSDSEMEGGLLGYETLKEVYRDNRVYFYTGTQPACYTMNGIEAMMTGIPIVSIGPKLGDVSFVKEQRSFEMHKIIEDGKSGFWSDDIDCLEERIGELLKDENLAKRISRAGRERAIELFGKEKIKNEWRHFFETL